MPSEDPRVTLRLKPETLKALLAHCEMWGVSRRDTIETALQGYLSSTIMLVRTMEKMGLELEEITKAMENYTNE